MLQVFEPEYGRLWVPPGFGTAPWNRECLSVFGGSFMLVPILGIPGKPWRPGFAFQTDEKTGLFLAATAEIGMALFGHERFRFSHRGITLKPLSGPSGTLQVDGLSEPRICQLPDADGPLAARSEVPWTFSEAPAGAIDSSNQVFTLTRLPIGTPTDPTRVQVYTGAASPLGLLIPGVDYTRDGLQLTLTAAPTTGDKLWTIYVGEPGAQIVGIPSGNTFGSAIISERIQGGGFANTNSFGGHTVIEVIQGGGFANTNGFGAHTVIESITGGGFANTNTFGAHTVAE